MNTPHVRTIFTALFVFCAPLFANAENVQILETIYMSSNTGNNHVSSGTITQAASTNSIDVHTEVNGKVIEDYHASSTKPIEYHSSYSTSSSDVYRLEKKIQKHVRESSALFVASTSSASIAHASATKKRLDSSRGDFIKSIQLLVAYIFNYATSQL